MSTDYEPGSGVSVGRLLRMSPRDRARRIEQLSPEVRLRVANLARYGVQSALDKAGEYAALIGELSVGADDA